MKQLEDIFQSFTSMSPEAQINKIREIRKSRTIERPAAAIKRVKKQRKVQKKTADAATKLIEKMSPAQKAALVQLLKERLSGAK